MKTCLLTALIALFVLAANAQSNHKPKPRIGIKAGAMLPIVTGLNDNDQSMPGFIGGVTSDFYIGRGSKRISVEVLYNEIKVKPSTGSSSNSISHISIPFLYRDKINNDLEWSIGPEFAFVAGAKGFYNVTDENIDDYYDGGIDPDVQSFYFGLSAGLRYFFYQRFFVDLTAVGSPTNITNYNSSKAHKLSLTLGFQF